MTTNIKYLDPKADLAFKRIFGKSVDDVDVSAFTDEELRAYDRFWDRVSSEKTLMEGRYDEGKLAKALEIAKKMKAAGMDADTICKMTGVEKDVIEKM